MLELIVATDNDWGFAKGQGIPWSFKNELKYFANKTKATVNPTKKNIVIMGRVTWETIPAKNRPLRDRINIIVSTSLSEENRDDLFFVKSIEDAIKISIEMYLSKRVERVFIIGGLALYDYAMSSILLSRIYLTKIHKSYSCDRFFNSTLMLSKSYHVMESSQYTVEEDRDGSMVPLTYMTFESKHKYEGEEQYLAILWNILTYGHIRQTRNSTTRSLFDGSMTFDLSEGFPLMTTKRLPMRWIWEELMFFLSGKTDTNILSKRGVTIWESNTTREFLDKCGLSHYDVGDMGPIYSFPLRHAGVKYINMHHDYTGIGFDQVAYVIKTLKEDPYSRRIIMTTFDPSQAGDACLYPCHGIVINFGVDGSNRLNCIMHQRSADWICGIPWNIASYATLVHLLVEIVNNSDDYHGPVLSVGKLTLNIGDMHVYNREDHMACAIEQLTRMPKKYPTFRMKDKISKIEDLKWEQVELINYDAHPSIKVKMVA